MMILSALMMFHLAFAQPRPTETYRFELVMNNQSCTRAEGEGFVCGQDSTRELIEIALDPVTPDPLEDRALVGDSPTLGLALNANVQYRPSVNVRQSVVGDTKIFTVRFKTERPDGPSFETVYIEEGDELGLPRPLTLMADRFGPGQTFFRQISFVLNKI